MGAKRMNLPCNMHEFTLLNARDSTAICCILQGKMLELAMYLGIFSKYLTNCLSL